MAKNSDVDRYIHAGTRNNTRRSYQSAVRHFEEEWGGFLPATSDSIARYLVDNAGILAVTTLKQRLAGLAQWHITQGFPDPTKAPMVRQVLRGIRTLHPRQGQQATPLQLKQIAQVVAWLDQQIQISESESPSSRYYRDKALLLLGFWRGFRGDELCRLQIEHINAHNDLGMQIFIPQSKGDREAFGQLYQVPALMQYCPVQAYLNWISIAGIENGPVFRPINRWGAIQAKALSVNSINHILRNLLERAGIAMASNYSSHSLRRGFATWANDNGWDTKSLMQYVGWKDVKSAMRYIDTTGNFGKLAKFKELLG
mgnify:CR=1 FL=1